MEKQKEKEEIKKQKIDICKDCGAFLEPEFDIWYNREVIKIFGIKEIIEGWGIKECRVCGCKNKFIEEINRNYIKTTERGF